MGETPQAAMAGTSSCMAPSGISVSTPAITGDFCQIVPSILPCSQSTQIQSGLALARALEILVLGTMPACVSDCHNRGGSAWAVATHLPDPIAGPVVCCENGSQSIGLLHSRGCCHVGRSAGKGIQCRQRQWSRNLPEPGRSQSQPRKRKMWWPEQLHLDGRRGTGYKTSLSSAGQAQARMQQLPVGVRAAATLTIQPAP